MHWDSIFNIIIATFCMCLSANAGPPGNGCRGNSTDPDRLTHVQTKCAEENLSFYRVAHCHYCCGCAAGQFVAEDCSSHIRNSTVCRTCPANSFTSSANVQRMCTVSKPSSYCDTLQFTGYVKGNSTSDARCECVHGTYALDPMINGCRKHSAACAKDFVVANFGNSTHDILCKPCERGYCTSGYEWALECRLPPCTSKTNSSKKADDISEKTKPPDPTSKTSTSSRTTTVPTKGTPVAVTSTQPIWIGFAIGLVLAVSIMSVVCCCLCHKGYRMRKPALLSKNSWREQDNSRSATFVEMENVDGTATQRENENSTSQPTSGDTHSNRHSNNSGQGTSMTNSGTVDGSTKFFTPGENISRANQASPTPSQESSGEHDPLLGCQSEGQSQGSSITGRGTIGGSPNLVTSADNNPVANQDSSTSSSQESFGECDLLLARQSEDPPQGTSMTDSGTVDGSTKFFTPEKNISRAKQDSPTPCQESSGERDPLLGSKSKDQPQFQSEGSQDAAIIFERPQIEDSAYPYNTEVQPLERRIRTEDPETYHNYFHQRGFAVRYEPTVGSYSLLAAIVMGLNSNHGLNTNLSEDQVPGHVTGLLERVTQYIGNHQARFREAILRNSSTVDEYLAEIKRGTLVCGEIMAEAIALSEGLTVKILSTNGQEFVFNEGPMDVLIGHVQDNYYLLLCDLVRSRNADPEASSNTTPVADSRVETYGQAMAHSYSDNKAASHRSAKVLGNSCGAVQGECAAEDSMELSDLPPLPQHCECLKEGYHCKVRELINKRPELESESFKLMQDTELAKQMLEGSNSLPDEATGLAEKSILDVKAFFKCSGMVRNWSVTIEDLETSWSSKDPNGLKDKLISLVISEQGSKLTVEKLIKSVRRNPSLYRLFCDNFIACLEMKCKET